MEGNESSVLALMEEESTQCVAVSKSKRGGTLLPYLICYTALPRHELHRTISLLGLWW